MVVVVRCGATAVGDVRSRSAAGCAGRGRVMSVLMQLVGVCVRLLCALVRVGARLGLVRSTWCCCRGSVEGDAGVGIEVDAGVVQERG